MNRSEAFAPVIRVAKYTFGDEARQKSFLVMFLICALSVFLLRGCYQGRYVVNGQLLAAGEVVAAVSKTAFHVIAVAVMLIAALVAMRLFRRDREQGMQAAILAKPIARWQYVAGKIAGTWALSTLFMFLLHGIVFAIASLSLHTVMPAYLAASLLCSLNLLWVIMAVLLLSLLMPDMIAFLCVLAVGIVGSLSEGLFALSQSPMAQAVMPSAGGQSGLTGWKVAYILWPKLAGAQQAASALIGHEGLAGWGALYPLVNVSLYILVLGALLFRRFRGEDIV